MDNLRFRWGIFDFFHSSILPLVISSIMLMIGLVACTSPDLPVSPPVDSTDTRTQTLATLIASDSSLSTLSRGLAAADLAGMLDRAGPYTVFAPTDAAFQYEALALDTLRAPAQRDSLRALLTYHIVRGRLRLGTADTLRVSTLRALPLLLWREASSETLYVAKHPMRRVVEAQNGLLYVTPTVLHPPPDSLHRRVRQNL